jgi:8-oxo-dGTP pyrophosphatase MutT (NUDIX family)
MEMLKSWQKIDSTRAADFGIFRIRTDRVISPRTQQAHDFYVIECVHWVNVIALTPGGEIVLIEQYRHGSETVELEIPGGMIDPQDASPLTAAVRELREETGYEGDTPKIIGEVLPNPAIMNNRCFTVLIENCHCRHPVQFDHGEDLVTRLAPVAALPELVSSGKIKHSLVVAALYYFELTRRGSSPA